MSAHPVHPVAPAGGSISLCAKGCNRSFAVFAGVSGRLKRERVVFGVTKYSVNPLSQIQIKAEEDDKITRDPVDVVTEKISERLLQIVPSAGLHHQGRELQMKH